ncbi:MAG: hypothetical protein ACOZIN_08475 [Myxococcota bacterium]
MSARQLTFEDVRADYGRRKSNKEGLRALLADGRWHGIRELHEVAGWRYGARIFDLRGEGLVIHRRPVGAGLYEWRWSAARGVDQECDAGCCLARPAGGEVSAP